METLTEENLQVLRLTQAMVGAITANFRRVSMEVSPLGVLVRFLLEKESAEDREEIEDILFEFEALQEQAIELDVEIQVDSRPLSSLILKGRPVLGRKE